MLSWLSLCCRQRNPPVNLLRLVSPQEAVSVTGQGRKRFAVHSGKNTGFLLQTETAHTAADRSRIEAWAAAESATSDVITVST